MKTYFIINPKAGTGKSLEELKEKIKTYAPDATVYETKAPGDAEVYVKNECEAQSGELKFIACGGDGTFNEVINGAFGHEGVSVGILPIGTGNDFCRNFPKDADFFDIKSQLDGQIEYCDVIEFKGEINGKMQQRYCANMFNIGFDCNAADLTAKLKKYPFIKGHFAYLLAVLFVLIKKDGAKLKITSQGETLHDGKLLLTSISNGSFCGGGVKSNPEASLKDGMIDLNIIRDISRIGVLKLYPHYAKGTHLTIKGIEKTILHTKCKKIEIKPICGDMKLCIDGEIVTAKTIEFEIVEKSLPFCVPMKKQAKTYSV